MFKVAARTVLELGSELISSDIIALYELIKNGFDAGTKTGVEIRFEVVIRRVTYLNWTRKPMSADSSLAELQQFAMNDLIDSAPKEMLEVAEQLIAESVDKEMLLAALRTIYEMGRIVVSDTGSGMSKSDLEKKFLVIGTPSRKVDVEQAMNDGAAIAPFLGEKGIGRLSTMRLGNRLRVTTARIEEKRLNHLDIDWSLFSRLDVMLEDINVEPTIGQLKDQEDWSGTKIEISKLTEDWTESKVSDLVSNDLSRLTDPFLDQKSRPKIRVFWNDKRLTIPWMDRKLLERANARASANYIVERNANGEMVPRLECTVEAIDLGFDHLPQKERLVIEGIDLKSVTGGPKQTIDESALVDVGPFSLEVFWFNRQIMKGIEELKLSRDEVKALHTKWAGIMIFRDGFRVFPYGDEDNDWLRLDRKALRSSGYVLNTTQFIGHVRISRMLNPALEDQTNREGLRVTPEQQVFLGLVRKTVQEELARLLNKVRRENKAQKIDLGNLRTEVQSLQQRGTKAIKSLRTLVWKTHPELVEELEQTMLEFYQMTERARQRIGEVERESQQMVEMAGVGLLVEVIAHELARASEDALQNLEAMRGQEVPVAVRQRLESLRSQMKSLSKRVRILDPVSVSGRQRVEVFDLCQLLDDALSAHESQFLRHNIEVKRFFPDKPLRIQAVKGHVIQILENMISNSKYWLQLEVSSRKKVNRHESFQPTITITLESNPPIMIFEDNGPGIAVENKDRVFTPFFSLKEESKRRGLGLYIARECAALNQAVFELDGGVNPDTGRLHRFVLTFPYESAVL